ncbi:hypothetical protein [Paenibacillus sp. EPM92]|uniref:hypothetical protein n=1 Tax=Paenibacillus sp. EPM92 TaxID=1561195 RepID=UPI001914EAB2|nr:hypothetical protein [Paenibacillus sp. EPM92]
MSNVGLLGSKVFLSFVELGVATILTMSLFRFPLKYNYYKFIIISLVMTSISFYLRDVLLLSNYAIPSMLISEMILITVLFNLPVYYSLFISVIGFMAGALMEYAVIIAGDLLGLTNPELIATNVVHSSLIYMITSIITIMITIYIRYRKFGFMFLLNKMTMREGIKRYNFAISAILVMAMCLLQVTSLSYNKLNIHSYVLIGLAISFFVALYISYKHNKKLINEKYERMKNR